MKYTLPLMAFCLLLGGCATPLDPKKDASRIAASLNIPEQSVVFTSYCVFDEARKWPKPSFSWNEGAVVLTQDSLIITSDKFNTKTGRQKIEVKLNEMKSIAQAKFGLGRQIQITHGDFLIVMLITANKAFGSHEASNRLLGLISAQGIPVVDAEKFYDLKLNTPFIIPIVM